jgi:hypothetical protein
MFDVDPDKPNIPALARILSGMGLLCLIGSAVSGMLAFAGYDWVNENVAMAGAVGGFLLALIFVALGKIMEQLAVVSARLKSRFAIDGLTRNIAATGSVPAMSSASSLAPKPGVITQPVKERVIHVPDEQARQQGFKVR